MRLLIIGTGYVGLVTGACFAEMGNDVFCFDINEQKIEKLNQLELPIYEPGLEGLLVSNFNNGRLKFTTNLKQALRGIEIVFIAVGTPQDKDGNADLSSVLSAARDIGKYMLHDIYVVDKSTVPVGTASKVRQEIQQQLDLRVSQGDLINMPSFEVISNPEFLKEGAAVSDCMRPDRVVIGTNNEKALAVLKELYMPFIRNTENFIAMDTRSAEMTKYVANAMLATKISFMNEMANICERVGADINKVRIGIGSDQRIGYHFIYPGCGYGGSCFPKDLEALIQLAKEHDYDAEIIQSVQRVNQKQKQKLASMITHRFGNVLFGKTFAIWGLSFKPETDDMREAPSLTLISELIGLGAFIKVYDPKAMMEARTKYLNDLPNIEYMNGKYEAIAGADALVLVTEWKEFRSPDFEKMQTIMKQAIIFDGRNQYNPKSLKDHGFEYYQIGVGENLII